jgi:hypothetical protein
LLYIISAIDSQHAPVLSLPLSWFVPPCTPHGRNVLPIEKKLDQCVRQAESVMVIDLCETAIEESQRPQH